MTLNVGVTGKDRLGSAFTVGAKASNLNRHGGTIAIPKDLNVGSTLELRNAKQAQTSARVVRLIREHAGTRTYGVEFLAESAGFWGIVFPTSEPVARSKRPRNEF
jgi:hypothetical protein